MLTGFDKGACCRYVEWHYVGRKSASSWLCCPCRWATQPLHHVLAVAYTSLWRWSILRLHRCIQTKVVNQWSFVTLTASNRECLPTKAWLSHGTGDDVSCQLQWLTGTACGLPVGKMAQPAPPLHGFKLQPAAALLSCVQRSLGNAAFL
jgi:hypothetical protein